MYNVIYIRFYFLIAFLFDVHNISDNIFCERQSYVAFLPFDYHDNKLGFRFLECWELDTLDLSKVTMT